MIWAQRNTRVGGICGTVLWYPTTVQEFQNFNYIRFELEFEKSVVILKRLSSSDTEYSTVLIGCVLLDYSRECVSYSIIVRKSTKCISLQMEQTSTIILQNFCIFNFCADEVEVAMPRRGAACGPGTGTGPGLRARGGGHHHKGVFCRRCGTKVTTTAHTHNVPTSNADLVKMVPEIGPGAMLSRHRSSPSSMWFDVATFKRATNVVTQGKPQDAQSFFPPYRWEPIFCKTCGAHIGWRFVANRKRDDGKTCPLDLDLPPMRPPDLSGSAQRDLADVNVLPAQNNVDESPDASAPASSSTTTKKKRPKASSLIATLKGYCTTKQMGYWIYEWCFQKHVRQFHLEPYKKGSSIPTGAKLVTVSGTKYIRNPDWSLGQWEPKAHKSKAGRKPFLWPDTKKKGKTHEPKFVSHLHLGGQRCDETNDGRRTEVRMLCCAKGTQTGEKGSKTASGASVVVVVVVVVVAEVAEVQATRREEIGKTLPFALSKKHPHVDTGWKSASRRCVNGTIFVLQVFQSQNPHLKIEFKTRYTSSKRVGKNAAFGLIWDRLLLQDSPSYRWIASVEAMTGIRRER